jgi:hypothetical protein
MYYTVYKITNLLNNKIYIGLHKTLNLEDGYMGSGLLIARAIELYGIENFKKEYLAIFDNPEDMCELELTLVNEEFVKSDENYNVAIGGQLGWGSSVKGKFLNDLEFRKNVIEQAKSAGKLGAAKVKELYKTDEKFKKKRLEDCGNAMLGKKHSDETKEKFKILQKNKHWITNNTECKFIDKDEPIPEGWRLGRIIKNRKPASQKTKEKMSKSAKDRAKIRNPIVNLIKK